MNTDPRPLHELSDYGRRLLLGILADELRANGAISTTAWNEAVDYVAVTDADGAYDAAEMIEEDLKSEGLL